MALGVERRQQWRKGEEFFCVLMPMNFIGSILRWSIKISYEQDTFKDVNGDSCGRLLLCGPNLPKVSSICRSQTGHSGEEQEVAGVWWIEGPANIYVWSMER